MSIIDGWTKAEQAVFKKLIKAVGGREGVNAFLGALPTDTVNVWCLDTGGGDAEQPRAGCWASEVYGAVINGVFTSRAASQDFCGHIKKMLSSSDNLRGEKNVQLFAPARNPEIRQDVEEQVTVVSWPFELYFYNS